ncbi:hypothetical protein CB0940_03379 [Cercospora beticola]|uniref:Uncharacterized protein n=1 Tax=Cercospora beticola TaxID=122368 RepID=A0A2G5I415_CERBT|nr:hypothetical protein CB0940_03379 [Cercospora beticola]PIA99556.1 hypothetical protein CB0940_03379 [Cercospora beticola]WPB00555.1 hypothetical protein RHO25_005175 [Cercospora beticola]CAK1361228.1 unnamed protein product [Cercospora beticola]
MSATIPQELPPNFFTQDSALGVRNPLWGRIKPRTRITLEHHEDALRLGARYTIEDLVDFVATARPSISVDIRHVSTRLTDAGDFVAKAYGVERAVVRREFEAAQKLFGVSKRKDLLAAARRRGREKRRGRSGSAREALSERVATVPTEDVAEDSDEMETVELMRVERAASILAGLSRRAWEEEISVEECEERMREREDGFD